jgi:small-conductance mechanosensitive channel
MESPIQVIQTSIKNFTNQNFGENVGNIVNSIFNVLNFEIFGVSFGTFILMLLCVILILKIVKIAKVKGLKRLEDFVAKKNIKLLSLLLDQIDQIGNPFYITLTLLLVGGLFGLTSLTSGVFYPAFIIVCGFYSIGMIKTALSWLISISLANPNSDPEEQKDEAFVQMLQILVGILTYVFVFLTVGQILNWNLSLVMGGLGVTSIAIAFALQNILADVFAAFTIFIDQPFRPGDQIVLEKYTGTVKEIGLKSTRISLLDGDELIVSNQDLTSSRVRNLRKIKARRVTVELLLDPDTKVDKIRKAREIIIKTINEQEHTEFRRINFIRISQFGKEIEYIYLIQDQQYDVYCAIQESINFKIVEEFEKEEIKFSKEH